MIVFTFFVTFRSDFIWSNPYLILRSSATKSVFTESNMLCKHTTSATKSGLLSFSSDSSASAVVAMVMGIVRWKLKVKANS